MLMLLELETRPFHGSLDASWQSLATPSVTHGQYVEELGVLYGFISPLEAALAYTPGFRGYLDIRRGVHAGMIAQDLLALGVGPSQLSKLPQCQLVPFGDPLEALGWLFLRERARKAHLHLEEHLRGALALAHDPCGYLAASTMTFDGDWTRLGQILDGAVRNSQMEEIVIEAAASAHERAVAWRTERQQGEQRTA